MAFTAVYRFFGGGKECTVESLVEDLLVSKVAVPKCSVFL